MTSEQVSLVELTYENLMNLKNHFSPAFDVGGVTIAIFIIWLTLHRMVQTDERIRLTQKQLELIDQNNRFNNYYKHQEQFAEFLNNTIIKDLLTSANIGLPLRNIYKEIYYDNYKDFKPNINENSNKIISLFLNTVKNSEMNKYSFNMIKCNYEHILKLCEVNFSFLHELLEAAIMLEFDKEEITEKLIAKNLKRYLYKN